MANSEGSLFIVTKANEFVQSRGSICKRCIWKYIKHKPVIEDTLLSIGFIGQTHNVNLLTTRGKYVARLLWHLSARYSIESLLIATMLISVILAFSKLVASKSRKT